jgi:hypothetical protein
MCNYYRRAHSLNPLVILALSQTRVIFNHAERIACSHCTSYRCRVSRIYIAREREKGLQKGIWAAQQMRPALHEQSPCPPSISQSAHSIGTSKVCRSAARALLFILTRSRSLSLWCAHCKLSTSCAAKPITQFHGQQIGPWQKLISFQMATQGTKFDVAPRGKLIVILCYAIVLFVCCNYSLLQFS